MDLKVIDTELTGSRWKALVTENQDDLTEEVIGHMMRANHRDLALTLKFGDDRGVPYDLNHNLGILAMQRTSLNRYSVYDDYLRYM